MKKVFLLLLILSNFLQPNQVKAAENWVIEDFQSNIILQENGEVRITETIAVDFSDISKHGIFRDIPYIYKNVFYLIFLYPFQLISYIVDELGNHKSDTVFLGYTILIQKVK